MSIVTSNLKGKVEHISDKKIPPIFIDEDWDILIDTSQVGSITFQNKYFDKNGYLTNLKYYDKDSTLLLNSEILYSNSGKYKVQKTSIKISTFAY